MDHSPPAAVVQFRLEHGLCYLCNAKCFDVMVDDSGHKRRLEPLTIENEVHRGRCLRCQPLKRGRKRPLHPSARPAEAQSLEVALGFHSKATGAPDLLVQVLSYLCTSTDLAQSRRVCRSFRLCADKVARMKVGGLVGTGVRPMAGQSIIYLLRCAEKADEPVRNYLKGWDPDAPESVIHSFDVGLERIGDKGCVIASIGVTVKSVEATLPVRLEFNRGLAGTIVGTQAYLPDRFPHPNMYPGPGGWGKFILCHRSQLDFDNEKTIVDILRRVKHDLFNPDLECPHCLDPFELYYMGAPYDKSAEPSSLYTKYQEIFFNMFSRYRLGHPFPDLQPLYQLVHNTVESVKARRRSGGGVDG